jgi:hypothetical protein
VFVDSMKALTNNTHELNNGYILIYAELLTKDPPKFKILPTATFVKVLYIILNI